MARSANVRVRFAPSPTGGPHLGNIRTALFNWLLARATGGSFMVRIEDTDQARKVEGAVDEILEALRWLGVEWDEGPDVGGSYAPYYQSQRLDRYHAAAQRLIDAGKAYPCYCTPERLQADAGRAGAQQEQHRLRPQSAAALPLSRGRRMKQRRILRGPVRNAGGRHDVPGRHREGPRHLR